MSTDRTFAVVTDSTADIAPALASERGIEVVPLLVTFGDESLPDGVLTQPEFFARMAASPQLPTTSQPSVGAFVEAYERALATAPAVISLHISSALSGTMASARQAAEQFSGRVHVFDSLNLSWGLALQVLDAATAAVEGLSPAAALERLLKTRDRTKMIVGVDSLDNLARGGRIGKVSAFLGSLLDLKVTLTLDENGAFTPVKRTRGEKAAIAHTLEWVDQQMNGRRKGIFAVGHAMTEERAFRLRDALMARYDVTEMFVYEAGSVVAAHTGTVWGVALLPAE
ncbi:MAG: DegV family protein [Actinomycetota bacterium]|nr:MAG: degV family [Actinomycetota bacterium]MDO8949226.1 DegV family protein [Actinomycetota bacterium]MDP3630736.1 DegV family protein [Actinomycetota bacterium]